MILFRFWLCIWLSAMAFGSVCFNTSAKLDEMLSEEQLRDVEELMTVIVGEVSSERLSLSAKKVVEDLLDLPRAMTVHHRRSRISLFEFYSFLSERLIALDPSAYAAMPRLLVEVSVILKDWKQRYGSQEVLITGMMPALLREMSNLHITPANIATMDRVIAEQFKVLEDERSQAVDQSAGNARPARSQVWRDAELYQLKPINQTASRIVYLPHSESIDIHFDLHPDRSK